MKKKLISLVLTGVMILSLGATAFASSVPDNPAKDEVDLEGQGHIAKQGDDGSNGDGNMIDVTIPSNGFYWYANENTAADASGNLVTDDVTPITQYLIYSAAYEITNNSDKTDLKVTFLSYDAVSGSDEIAANSLKADITLALSGDLANSALEDLLNDAPTSSVDLGVLEAGEDWEYGFKGNYAKPTLPTTAATSDYVMVLEFEAVGAPGSGN